MARKHAKHDQHEHEWPEAELPAAEAPSEEAAAGPVEEPGAVGDRVQQLEAEVEDWKKRCLYAVAENDNVRRRARLDAEEARKFATERLVGDLLPVLDNFALALQAAEQNGSAETLKSGVDLIHRQLGEALGRAGLQRVEALGQPFDPNQHEAIMQVEPQDGQEPQQVVEELRAGYRLNERMLRPTLVKITYG